MPETEIPQAAQTDSEGFRRGKGFTPAETLEVPKKAETPFKVRLKRFLSPYAVSSGAVLASIMIGACNEGDGGGAKVTIGENTPGQSIVIEMTPTATTPSGETVIPGTNVAVPTETKPAATPTATETPKPAENPLYSRYDSLAAKIKGSEISSDIKSDLLKQLEGYKTIESVQDQLMKAYTTELGPDGKTPALLYYSWPKIPGVNQENQMFVLVNQGKIDAMRGQVDLLNGSFDGSKVKGVIDNLNRSLAQKPGEGNGLFIGVDISPADYKSLADPKSAPEVTFSGVSEDQKAKVLNLLGTKYAALRGDFEIRGITSGTSKTENIGGKTVVSINFSSPGAMEHELGHAENLLQTENSVPAKELIHLAVLAEKLLADPNLGRQWNSLDQLGKDQTQMPPDLPAFGDSALDRLMHDFANPENPGGIFTNGAIKFATDNTGAKITPEKFAALTKTGSADKKVFYNDLNAFLAGDKDLLDQLSANSKYFEMHISWFRENPQAYVNLAQKLSGIQFTHPSGRERSTYYGKDSVLFNDSVFAVKLLSGDAKALEYLNSLGATERSLLLNDAVARLQMADQEYFADMAKKSTIRPDSPTYVNAVLYFQSLREAFAKVSVN